MIFTGDRTNANFFGETMNRVMISKVNHTETRTTREHRLARLGLQPPPPTTLTIAYDFNVLKGFVRFRSFLVQRISGSDVREIVLDEGDRRDAHRRMRFQAERDDGDEYEEDGNDLDGLVECA